MPTRKYYRLAKRAPQDLFDPVREKSLLDYAYHLGYRAFLSGHHYSENPFNPNDWQRADKWDAGWAAAEHGNSGAFD